MSFATVAAALVTIAILSFLYRDNPLYRAAEHILVGLSVGFSIVLIWNSVLMPKLLTPLFTGRSYGNLLPLALGFLMLLRLKSSWKFLSKPVLALIIGAGAGVSIPNMFEARILQQMSASIQPFSIVATGESTYLVTATAILSLIGVISVLFYFFYTRPDNKFSRGFSQVGVYFLMVFFGATFGYTVTSRITLLIGRMEFLLGDFLHLL